MTVELPSPDTVTQTGLMNAQNTSNTLAVSAVVRENDDISAVIRQVRGSVVAKMAMPRC